MRLICTVAGICEHERFIKVNKTASPCTSYNTDRVDQNKNCILDATLHRDERNMQEMFVNVFFTSAGRFTY